MMSRINFSILLFLLLCGRYASAADIEHSPILWNTNVQLLTNPSVDQAYWNQWYGNNITSVSIPKLTQMRVGSTNWVFIVFRATEDTNYWSEDFGLAAIQAEHFMSFGVSDLRNWTMINPRIATISQDDHYERIENLNLVAVDGKLFFTWEYIACGAGCNAFDETTPNLKYKLCSFTNGQVSSSTLSCDAEGNLATAQNYKGPQSPFAALGLARVTTGLPHVDPNVVSDYFDSYQGRTIMSYECRGSTSCGSTSFSGVYVQEFSIVNGAPVFESTAIELYRHPAAYSKSLWYKQNAMVSAVGQDAAIFTMNYNSRFDAYRDYARDFPTYASYFLWNNITGSLTSAVTSTADYISLSYLMPDDDTWLGRIDSQYGVKIASNTYNRTTGDSSATLSTWDQGAVWSNVVYFDPYAGDYYTFYESWGAPSKDSCQHVLYSNPDNCPLTAMAPRISFRKAKRKVFSLHPRHILNYTKAVTLGVGTGNGENAYQYGYNGDDRQKFFLEAVDRVDPSNTNVVAGSSGTTYRLRAVHSRRCLDVIGGASGNGQTIWQWDCHSGPNQQVKIYELGTQQYKLVFQHSNRVMDIAGVSQQDNADVWQWDYVGGANQEFKIIDRGYR